MYPSNATNLILPITGLLFGWFYYFIIVFLDIESMGGLKPWIRLEPSLPTDTWRSMPYYSPVYPPPAKMVVMISPSCFALPEF